MSIYKAKDYGKIGELEVRKFREFDLLKEYEHFYLCGKHQNGKLLYKECFSKFDVDGIEPQEGMKAIYKRRWTI